LQEVEMKFTKETDIAAPPDKVYEYLADFSKHLEWTTPGHNVQIPDAPSGSAPVGASMRSTGHMFGSQQDQIKVEEMTPNQRIVYYVTMKNGDFFRQTMEIRPSGSGTHLTKSVDFLKMSMPSRLFMPVAMVIGPKILAGDVERIKERMEHPVSV
jgi:uncharacterized protein YndB with AHSA1/START domain